MTMDNRFVTNDLSQLQAANRSPIYGYQHLPVVPLEQAIKTIISIVPEVKQYVPLAKQNCHRSSSLLTWDESAAIYLYSMPGSFFTRLNEYLRAENRDALKPWFSFLKLFISALEKLPACDITVWRGVAGDVGSAFVENDMQTWWSVNSCSKALNVVEAYLGDKGTVFGINATNGKDISVFSVFQQEQEIILMPGSHFRVQSRSLNFQNKLFIVHLEEESITVESKKDASTNSSSRSTGARLQGESNARHGASTSRKDQSTSRISNVESNAQHNVSANQRDKSNNTQASSATNYADTSALWEPQTVLNLGRSLDLRCMAQRPIKARSLPKEMVYSKSAVMSANNKFLLLYGDSNLRVFDENLKLIRSTKETPVSSYDLVDMTWCESIQKFIILCTKEAYAFDPLTTQLLRIESVGLQEKESKFVSCTCSYAKLFIVTSESYHPSYIHLYKLPSLLFISRLTVADLIGSDLEAEKEKAKYSWSRDQPFVDDREIISVRYNQQRLGMLMTIKGDTILYSLDLTEQPFGVTKTKLVWNSGQLVVVAKSGEWLIVYKGVDDKLVQISLDCQFNTEWESKDYSQSSFFSLSTGFVDLKGTVTNAIILGSQYLVLLLDKSLALYNV